MKIHHIIASLLSIASGGSIGREGSMVQLSALSASLLGRVLENLRAQEPERSAVESRRAADRKKPGAGR